MPSLSLAATPRLAARRGGRIVPDGLLPQPAARLDDLSGWTLDAPDWSAGAGHVTKQPGAANTYVTTDVAIPAGDTWVAYTVTGATAGTAGVQLQGPFANTRFMNRITAQHVARFTGDGHTRMRVIGSAAFDGRIEDVQAVDMTALLAQPSDIYIAAGQSLIAAETKSTPVDPAKDYWLPRCLYIPGNTNNNVGSVAGDVAACAGPLQMHRELLGVSPALSFARTVEAATPAGRTVLIVACAQGGTRLVGDDAEWNPDATTAPGGSLYADMIAWTQAALARTPGSVVKGLIWGQGESDRSLVMDTTYPPAFANMLSRLRADLSVPDLPVALIGPMPDDTDTAQPLFLQTQQRLDQDSGHATAIPGVHYVARPAGYMSGDGTHPVPEGNRIAGRLAAQRLIAEGHI